ncbi:MAG: GTP-binding protein [Alphaproteobacteria bacterium]
MDDAHLLRARDTLQFLLGAVEAEALSAGRTRQDAANLPLVIVSGFLGAGKTTLLRRLLTADHGLRIAALVNDVADLDIDARLIASVSADTVSLQNGCVCCSQSGGAVRALLDVAARPDRPDLVLLEASGVADPWALAQIAGDLPGLRLDSVVSVVDAEYRPTDRSVEHLLERQIAAADLVLVNKIDLVAPETAARLVDKVTVLAPRAETLRTVECAIPPALVFGLARDPRAAPDGPVGDDLFRTWRFVADEPLDRDAFETAMEQLPPGILRAKGFVRLTETLAETRLLQRVGRRWRWDACDRTIALGAELALIGLVDVEELPLVGLLSKCGLRMR